MSFAVREIAKSATRALGAIIAKFKALGGGSYISYKKLYESSVEPILRYAAGIWGVKEQKVLNTVQNKAARFILGVPKTSPNLASRGDLGWSSWFCKQKVEVVRLWLRLKCMDTSRLASRIYKYCCNKAVTCKFKNWEGQVITVFKSCGLEFLVDIEDFDSKSVLKHCKDILHETDCSDWYRSLRNNNSVNGGKLCYYRTFKPGLSLENYLLVNLPVYKKRCLQC